MDRVANPAEEAAWYVADAVAYANAGAASVIAYIAARAAERAGQGHDAERAWQAQWLRDRLEL